MSSTSFAFRPDKKIGPEFIRVLQRMAVHARTLKRCRRGKQSEAIHETRVLIKRLRALLWFANRTLSSSQLTEAKSRLREASHLLAPQRDLVVLRSTLQKLSRDSPNSKDRKILSRISFSHPPDSQQAIDEKSVQSLRRAIVLLLETIDQIKRSAKACSTWPSPSDRLARALHATEKTGEKARHEGKAVAFHNWRKKTKRLLYQLQLTEPAPNHRMARAIRRVDKLQNILGDYHDSVVVQDHLRKSPPDEVPPSLVKRSVKLLEKRKRRLQKKAGKAAQRMKAQLAP